VLWKRKDGKQISVRLSARPVPGEGQFEMIVEDISKNIELEAQLRQAQKLEALGALAGGIAHDFNNVLMIIDAYAEMALDQVATEDPLRARVEKMFEAAKRGTNLTRQLLAFSRKQVLEITVLRLDALVAELREMLKPLIGEDIILDVKSSPNLWQVRADPGKIEQVILNLVVNARDAMPHGGRLTLGMRNVQLDASFAEKNKGAHTGEFVELFVTDTGCGMSPELQARIFDPFFTTKPMGKGTGLGLSTAYGIIKQSEGYIRVESGEGLGTTFRVYLPRDGSPEAQVASTQEALTRRTGNFSILVVEDEAATCEAICAYLEQQGFRVTAAANASEALAACSGRENSIDLILTDVILPGLSGSDLVKQLQPQHPHMKVIFMSGYTNDRISGDTLTRAGFHFLQKPFALPELVGKIHSLLS
jgi:signal transduction histidine kinase